MSELVTKSVAQEQPGQKIETRTAAQRVAGFTVVVTASDKFTADEKSLADCGHSCHVAVKAKDYIFHPCQKR